MEGELITILRNCEPAHFIFELELICGLVAASLQESSSDHKGQENYVLVAHMLKADATLVIFSSFSPLATHHSPLSSGPPLPSPPTPCTFPPAHPPRSAGLALRVSFSPLDAARETAHFASRLSSCPAFALRTNNWLRDRASRRAVSPASSSRPFLFPAVPTPPSLASLSLSRN